MQIVAWSPPGSRAIPLHRRDGTIRSFAWVDEADYESISRYAWSLSSGNRVMRHQRINGKSTYFKLHREIMGLKAGDGLTVDHINRNPLDNRRRNLRICTHAENRQNNGANRSNPTGMRGVRWDSARGKWQTQVTVNYKNHHLGRYDRLEDAAAAVAAFRRQHMPFSVER